MEQKSNLGKELDVDIGTSIGTADQEHGDTSGALGSENDDRVAQSVESVDKADTRVSRITRRHWYDHAYALVSWFQSGWRRQASPGWLTRTTGYWSNYLLHPRRRQAARVAVHIPGSGVSGGAARDFGGVADAQDGAEVFEDRTPRQILAGRPGILGRVALDRRPTGFAARQRAGANHAECGPRADSLSSSGPALPWLDRTLPGPAVEVAGSRWT